MEHTALDIALDGVVNAAAAAGRTPLLGDVAHTLAQPALLDQAHAAPSPATSETRPATSPTPCAAWSTATSCGMFDAPSTVVFDPASPMLSIDLSRLGGSGDDTALVLAMTCASAWMESALTDPRGGRRWIVYDEAWRLMRHPALLQRMQSQWKLSRGLGIANLMVIHRLSDLLTAGDAGSQGRALAEGLLADCSTRIVYRQETDQVHAAAALLGLTSVETEAISHLSRGRGLWKVMRPVLHRPAPAPPCRTEPVRYRFPNALKSRRVPESFGHTRHINLYPSAPQEAAIEFHPTASFLPLLDEDDLTALTHDIQENGLLQPVVLDRHGRVLDGRGLLHRV